MSVAVIDAGIAIGWIQGRHRSGPKLDRLFRTCREGQSDLVISVVNLAEVLIHTADLSRATGVDAIALLIASRVRIHQPDEAIARRVAKLRTSLADGFAAATAKYRSGVRSHSSLRGGTASLRAGRTGLRHRGRRGVGSALRRRSGTPAPVGGGDWLP